MKRFGGRERPKTEKFELETIGTTGETKIRTFQVVPVLQAGDVVSLMDALDQEPEKCANAVSRLLTKVMDDSDGTPHRWAPPTLAELGVDSNTKPADVTWTGPDGESYTMADTAALAKFTSHDAGSSRRRWNELMDPRNDEGIELMDLVEIGQWVVTLSTDRPTPARTPSSRASRKTPR